MCVSVSSMDVKCLLLWASTAVSGFRCTCNHCVCMNVCCTQCASCESRVDAASLLVVSIFSLFNVCSFAVSFAVSGYVRHVEVGRVRKYSNAGYYTQLFMLPAQVIPSPIYLYIY